MTDVSFYDEVRSSIAAEDLWIADRMSTIQEVLQGLQAAKRPLAVEDLQREFQNIRRRFDEKRLVIAVSGLTSSGKSTLLNALLGFDFLFTAPDHCTPCSVSIQRSPNSSKTFFKDSRDPGSLERSIAELATATDLKSNAPSHRPLFVFLSAEQSHRGILRVSKQLRLVDSPGIHESSFKESSDMDADALAFVIDLCSGTKWEDLAKVMEVAGLRTKPVLVVFSKIDQIQRYDQRRFEMEREKRLQEAKRFLEANEKATEEAIFFLAPKAAVIKRRHDAEVRALRKAILKVKKGRTRQQMVLLIGSERSGKTTLCADLIADRMPTHGGHGTPCFVIYTAVEQPASEVQFHRESSFSDVSPNLLYPEAVFDRRNENLHQQECFSIYEEKESSIVEKLEGSINVATHNNNPSSEIHVNLSKSTLSTESLLLDDVSVVDTPPLEDFEAPLTDSCASALIIVVSSEKHSKEMRNHIKECLRIAAVTSDTDVLLAVTKWKMFREQHANTKTVENRKRAIEEIFSSCLQNLRQPPSETRKVFFIESEELMEEYEASFVEFEKRLIKAAHDEFAAFKLEAIKKSVRKLLEEIQSRMDEKIRILEGAEAFFQGFADSISKKFLTDTNEAVHLRRTTRASRFLSPSRQLPDTESHMKDLFSEFLKYYQEDVTKEILQLSQNALERLEELDPDARETAKRFHDDEMKAIAKQLELKENQEGDVYGLSNMLEVFMTLIPKPVDEEIRLKIENLKKTSDQLLVLLNTLKNKELLTSSEMERLQRKWENLMSVDTSTDEALAASYAENLKIFKEELETMKPLMEERNQIAKETRQRANATYRESVIQIGVIEHQIKQMKANLVERLDHLNEFRRNVFLRFLNFLSSNRFTDAHEAACLAQNEEIKQNYEEMDQFEENAEEAIKEAEQSEVNARRYRAEFASLSGKKKKMEEDLDNISIRVMEAKEKMEEDKRNIVEKKKNVGDVLTQHRSKIQETEENLMKNQKDIRLTEEKFLEKKNRWDTMKREYYQKLLSELENMSNMLLRKILRDLHQRTHEFAKTEIRKLEEEKLPILSLQTRLSSRFLST